MKRRSFLKGLAAILVAPKALAQLAPGTTAQTIVLKDTYGIVGLVDVMESASLHGLSSSTYARWDRRVPPGHIFAFDKKCVHAFPLLR